MSKNFFEEIPVDIDRCFICGASLNEINRSEEHIYPKWLQRKFNLWTERLDLLNGTSIFYKDLRISCCQECNERMSSFLEKPIECAVENGYDDFIKIDRDKIFYWLTKIAYGMLFKELSLKIDRRNPNSECICDEEVLKSCKMQYAFLRTMIGNGVLHNKPYSLLIFKIGNGGPNYWAYDNPNLHTFYMVMNDIGIIAHLMDNSYNEQFFLQTAKMKDLLQKTLHPVQFAEVCARFHYKATLFNRNPNYLLSFEKDFPKDIISLEMGGIGYNDWEQKEYAEVLGAFLNCFGWRAEKLYFENDKVLSFLWGQDGLFKTI